MSEPDRPKDALFRIKLLIVFCLPLGVYYLAEDRSIDSQKKVIAFCAMVPLGLLMILVYAYLLAIMIVNILTM